VSAQRAVCPSTSCTHPRPTHLASCPRALGVRRRRCAKLPVAVPASWMTCPRRLAVCPNFVPHLDEKLCGCLRVCSQNPAGPLSGVGSLSSGTHADGIRQRGCAQTCCSCHPCVPPRPSRHRHTLPRPLDLLRRGDAAAWLVLPRRGDSFWHFFLTSLITTCSTVRPLRRGHVACLRASERAVV